MKLKFKLLLIVVLVVLSIQGTGWGRRGSVSLQGTDTKRDQEWERVGRSEQNIQVPKVTMRQEQCGTVKLYSEWDKTGQDKTKQNVYYWELRVTHTKNCSR